ncbi:MAG: CRISPR system precrRNA processing endoribonuclease RAMP protein Cas6 [Oscillospiraceae bacterium]|nr:CRISPR system precrRNA processing endoribonuclease RAMP protein Cas6 [Oscillospiraceae bacterium]
MCRVSTLNDEAAQILDALEKQDTIVVYADKKPILLTIEKISRSNPIYAMDIPNILTKKKYKIDIVTPATRKTSGEYTNRPDLCQYFTSVANKLKVYEDILIENSELEMLFANIKMSRYNFESRNYMIGGKNIPAMTGSCDISINSDSEQVDKIKLLLGYATYSGIGAKTSLGMGGFLVQA